MEEKLYSVSEAVRLIGVESHVLRYWEEELGITIQRTKQGHRIYSAENIATFRQVRELKEKGIQLKAIRVLLEETEEQAKIREQIEIFQHRSEVRVQSSDEKENLGKNEEQENLGEERDSEYEIIMQQEKTDSLRQFEAILKQMLTEVVEEQNEKLEEAIMQMLRSELEELYLQYFQSSMAEAAASREEKTGILRRIWNYIRRTP